MTVRLYRSTDAGAPVLGKTNDASLLTILRACLVTGYGSKVAAGWTMPFSDLPNKMACFRTANDGDYLRLDDSLDYRWASVYGFKTMSDLNTGTEQYPSSNNIGNGNHYRVSKRYSTSSINDGWMVIASEDWFYYIGLQNDNSLSYPSGFFFGKYESLNPSFTENFMLTGYVTSVTSTSSTNTYQALYGRYIWYVRRSYQNAQQPVRVQQNYISEDLTNPNPFTGSLELLKPYLRDTNSPYVRYGYMPNMFHVMGNKRYGYRGGEMFTEGAKKYVTIAYSNIAFAIEYDE